MQFISAVNHNACKSSIPNLTTRHSRLSEAARGTAPRAQPHHLQVHIVHTRRTPRRDARPRRRAHDDRARRIQQFEQLRPRLHARRRAEVQARVHAHGRDDGAVARGADFVPGRAGREDDGPVEGVGAGAPAVGLGRAAAGGALQDRFVPHCSDCGGAGGGRHAAAGFVGGDEGLHERLPGGVGEVGLRFAVFDGGVGGLGPDVADVVAFGAIVLGGLLAML